MSENISVTDLIDGAKRCTKSADRLLKVKELIEKSEIKF